jgi:hypothetical protein
MWICGYILTVQKKKTVSICRAEDGGSMFLSNVGTFRVEDGDSIFL